MVIDAHLAKMVILTAFKKITRKGKTKMRGILGGFWLDRFLAKPLL